MISETKLTDWETDAKTTLNEWLETEPCYMDAKRILELISELRAAP